MSVGLLSATLSREISSLVSPAPSDNKISIALLILMSTIEIPIVIPNPNVDCLHLHRAFHGIGCDADAVIDILAHRPADHRAQLKEVYRNMYQEDLCSRLQSELHLNFEKAMLFWMCEPALRDAYVLRDAMGTHRSKRKSILAETICLRSPTELRSVADVYRSKFHKSLLLDIRSATEGSFEKLLESYLDAVPEEKINLDLNEAQVEAEKLYRAGEGRPSLDHTYLVQLLTSRTREDLLSIFDCYKSFYGHEIFKGLKKAHGNSSQVFTKELIEVTKCISNPARHFAKVLRKSMKGLGTDDSTLIRVVVTRSEIDMRDIKSEFIRKYKVSLDRTISSDTSGNYRRFLLALIGAASEKDNSISKGLL